MTFEESMKLAAAWQLVARSIGDGRNPDDVLTMQFAEAIRRRDCKRMAMAVTIFSLWGEAETPAEPLDIGRVVRNVSAKVYDWMEEALEEETDILNADVGFFLHVSSEFGHRGSALSAVERYLQRVSWPSY